GYMLNYAIGAILVADLRARVKELHGPYAEGDPAWYAWMSERLYRFGLERPSRQVIEEFLGRPISPRALLDDMARARRASCGRLFLHDVEALHLEHQRRARPPASRPPSRGPPSTGTRSRRPSR